jgi:uncharacterized protein YndB with AHSA1/START domain
VETTAETTRVEREVAIAASPETVWEFLVDPDKLVRWMGLRAMLDPRPGGEYRCEVIPGNTARGTVLEFDAPRRLVHTWGWEPREDGTPNAVPPGSSTIEFELIPDGDGTLLRFVHRDLPSVVAAASDGHGWDHYLERLPVAASGGDPGDDPWLTNMERSDS